RARPEPEGRGQPEVGGAGGFSLLRTDAAGQPHLGREEPARLPERPAGQGCRYEDAIWGPDRPQGRGRGGGPPGGPSVAHVFVGDDLFRNPVPTPDQVRGRLFRGHALTPRGGSARKVLGRVAPEAGIVYTARRHPILQRQRPASGRSLWCERTEPPCTR